MPGTEVSLVDQVNPRSIPTDTGVCFLVGQSSTGPSDPQRITSIPMFESVYTTRTGITIPLHDALEVFFREGGAAAWVCKSADATNVGFETALDLLSKDLGPGQVLLPGAPVGSESALLAHAEANARIALLDAPDDPDPTVLETAATALNSDPNARHGAMFGPHLIINGLTAGTTRTIAPAAVVAGLMARSDRTNNPNVAAAGNNGQSRTTIGLSQAYTAAQNDALNEACVDMFRNIYGIYELYGYRTLSPKDTDPEWWQLTASRLYMAIAAYSEPALQRAVFAQIDGTRTRLGQLEGEVAGVLLGLYNAGALYGSDPTQAFRVDATSEAVNPEAQLADGLVKVAVEVRMSPFGEIVRLELQKTAITESLS